MAKFQQYSQLDSYVANKVYASSNVVIAKHNFIANFSLYRLKLRQE